MNADTPPLAESEAPIIVVTFEVKICGACKVKGTADRRGNAVQSQTAFVIVAFKAANQIQPLARGASPPPDGEYREHCCNQYSANGCDKALH